MNGSGGIFNMKIDTFDHKALLGPPKIPGLPDSVQLGPALEAAKKSNKKKKNKSSNSSMAVKQIESASPPSPPTSDFIHEEAAAIDPAKKLRNLRKKLRDIETLEKKLAEGELENPEPEQLEKVARKPVMLQEIADLEASLAAMTTS